jgi:hypothetical protein
MRARTGALIDECRRLRLQSAQRQRESLELRTACTEVGQARRASIERRKTLWCAQQIGEHSPWQLASASCVQAWIQSNAAIWRWLVAKGIDVGATKIRLAGAMIAL